MNRAKIIVAAVILASAFAAGFVPQYLKVSHFREEVQSLRGQLGGCQSEKALSDFRSVAGAIYLEVTRNNFGIAAEESTKFFSQLREFADRTADAALKSRLEDVMSARDRITGGLAKADPSVTAEIQNLFLKLRKL